MEYLLSALLFALNLLRHQYAFNQYIFLLGGLTLFCALFFACYKKTDNFIASCVMMLGHTWPYSWTNIFGTGTDQLQLPWFYVVGALIFGYFLLNIKKVMKREVSSSMLVSTVALAVLLLYPLFLSKSLTEGIKELLIIYFFLVLVFVALMFNGIVPYSCRKHITGALIFVCVVSGVLLVFQRIMLLIGVNLFKVSTGVYFGSPTLSVKLLMDDASSATIMLGCGVLYLFERIEEKKGALKIPYMLGIVVVLIGMGLTTRRTSVLTLAVVLVVYAFFHFKNIFAKIGGAVVCLGLGFISVWYLSISRSISDLDQLLYENVRFSAYVESMRIFAENPFGIGYDNVYLMNLVGGVVPHNTVIRWLVMSGIVCTVLLVFIILKIWVVSYKKKFIGEFWALFYAIVASNFIPDILNARFFIILCVSALFIAPENQSENKMLSNKI